MKKLIDGIEPHKVAWIKMKPYLNDLSNYMIDIGALRFDTSNLKLFVENGFSALMVEPNPASYNNLINQTSDLKNVEVVKVAINSKNGKVKFIDSPVKGHSRIPNTNFDKAKPKSPKGNNIEVDCWTFAKLLENYPQYVNSDFVDIDVEGNDEIVLAELFNTECRPMFIMIEDQNDENRRKKQKEMFVKENYEFFYNMGDSSLWKRIS